MQSSIVIVSYNVKDYISQCIRSIYKSDLNKDNYEIIVVDNNSHDGTCEEIINNFTHVKLHKNKTNTGFSKAVNKAVSLSSGEYIFILNPDVIVQDNTFSILLNNYSKIDKIGAVGPKILNSDGTIQHSCKRSFPTPLNSLSRLMGLDKLFPKSKFFGKYNLTYLNIDEEHEVDVLSGAFMMVPKIVYDKIDGFDERFFMFGEDIDFCHKIKDIGLKVIYSPLTEIIHYKGESVKNAPFDMINVFYSAMNLYYEKYSKKHKYWTLISFLVKIALMLRKSLSYIKLILSSMLSLLIDISFIIFSFTLSIYLWYTYQYSETVEFSKISYHYLLILNFIFSWVISSKLIGVYKKGTFSYPRVILSVIVTFLICSTSTYFISTIAYSRMVLFLSTILSLFTMLKWRFTIKFLYLNKIFFINSFKHFIERRALVIGADKETYSIGLELSKKPGSNINIIGYTDKDNPNLLKNFLGQIDYIKDIVLKNKITEIIVREDYISSNKIFKIIKKIKGLNLVFKIIPEGKNILLSKGLVENVSGIELLSYEIPFLDRSNIFIKRIFDIILSFSIITITFPFLLILYFLYRLKTEIVWGMDTEIIKLKHFKCNNNFISALPLIYYVFIGKLSFVGSGIIGYNKENPNYILKPGLTGLLNLKKFGGNSNSALDQYYIKNYSLIFDLEIILKSLFKI